MSVCECVHTDTLGDAIVSSFPLSLARFLLSRPHSSGLLKGSFDDPYILYTDYISQLISMGFFALASISFLVNQLERFFSSI